MDSEPKAYTTGIEKKLIEYIGGANQSIKIAMAWFTNKAIKDCLIRRKRDNQNVNIEIVVDENEVNRKYFFDYKSKFNEVEILIKKKADKRFLHHKFMIIDGRTTITGSYNYSKKAESNLENIIVVHSEKISSYYSRIFKFFTEVDYFDENIKLLLDYPDFAQKIISTYYDFTKSEYLKYKDKIEIGNCFTHENGMYNEIKYSSGLIFNPKFKHDKDIKPELYEFDLPIDKEIIKHWIENRNFNLLIDYYNGKEDIS